MSNFESSNNPPKKSGEAGEEPAVIHWRIDQWFPKLDPEVRKQLKVYHAEIIKFNKTINLVSPKTVPLADAIHFADSILASQIIGATPGINEIYDFGSGNGFPGLIYALLHKKTKVHLVDSDGRKAEFLKHMAALMGLKNTQVHIKAIESLPEKSIEFAMSRGFATIPKAILSTRKLFKLKGAYFHLKSEEWVSEVAQIPTQLCSYWAPELFGEYKLPIGEVKFAIVRTDKIGD